MKKPVLVRIRTDEVDRFKFAVEANQDDKLAMTAIYQKMAIYYQAVTANL